MPQPLHVARVLEQVLVDVFAENDLLLHRDRRIEIHLQIAHARRPPRQLDAELLPRVRLEIGVVTPQFILLERVAVMQPHDQRGINLVEESREAIVHEHRRKLRLLLPFAAIVAGKDEEIRPAPRTTSGRRLRQWIR